MKFRYLDFRNFVFILSVFFLLSCNKKNDKPQTLRTNSSVPVSSYHPCKACDMPSNTVCKSLYEGLLRVDEKKKPILALAKTMTVSEDQKTYTFTLKETKWSNGESVTAYHFLNCWKNCLTPTSFQKKHFYFIKNAKKFCKGIVLFHEVGMKAIDEKTIQIELEYPNPFFLEILAAHMYSPVYESDMDAVSTVFNGPYVVDKYDVNKGISLKKNPLYWDVHAVKIDKIEISFIKDPHTALSMYEKGKLDWIGDPFSSIPVESIPSHPEIKSKPICSPFLMFCNANEPKLQSSKIRKTLYYSLNHDEIVQNIMFYQEKLASILPKNMSSLYHDTVLKGPNSANKEPPEKLFEEGLKEIGVRKKDFILNMSYNNSPSFERLAVYLKRVWEKRFNIQVNLYKEDWNTFYPRVKTGDYEIGGFFMISMVQHPFYFLDFFERQDKNYAFWENQDFQTQFELAKHALSESERQFYMEKAEEILMEEMPVIPICNWTLLYLCKDHLEGFEPPNTAYSDFKLARFVKD